MAGIPVIPEFITVHLGAPDSYAANITVTFPEYIKNVASSEIYPTWDENALRANIYAQISFALNRIYTEYYPSRGYNFDITNSTAFDQSFVNGRDIFENISKIVDDIFTSYISRQGSVEPLFAQYCNGTTVTCEGMSQWGSQSLAEQGYTPYQILTYYYGNDIDIVNNTPVQNITASVPKTALRLGSAGNDVLLAQIRLNRISNNYPLIPKIYPTDGIFDLDTENSVKKFQTIFNLTPDGIIGNATWYKIQYIYNAVKRINELNSEGITLDEISKQFREILREGDSGNDVKIIQYFLAYVAQYETSMNPIAIDGYFGPSTTQAVKAFQNTYDLVPDGIIGELTYDQLITVYRGIIQSLPEDMFVNMARPYAGSSLVLGEENEQVRYLQEYLNYISNTYTTIPKVEVNGIYTLATQNAVTEFQRLFDIPESGVTGAVTWNAVASVYDDLRSGQYVTVGQYPGYAIS